MNSATDIWPDGLGSSSGELGHNIMDHHYNLGISGDVVSTSRDLQIYTAIKEITCVALATRAVQAVVTGAGILQNSALATSLKMH